MGKFWGDYRGGVGKVACWSTKAAISLKRVKINKKLLWRAYVGTLFRTVPSPTPYGLSFPKIGVRNPTQNCNRYYLRNGWGKATDCKFGRYIHSVHPNKSPWNILEKRKRGRIQGLPKFFEYPVLPQEWVKLRTLDFVRTFTAIDRNKSPLKFSAKVAVGVLRDFQGIHISLR